MATARPLNVGVQYDIAISSSGTVPLQDQTMQIGPYDSIEFTNNAPFPVNIIFTNQFPNVTNLAQRQTSGQSSGNGTPLNLTINYTIQNANTQQQTGGPYAVQFGIGPLPIAVTVDHITPSSVAIPPEGEIQITSDGTYPISWSPSNLFAPQPSSLVPGQNPVMKAQAGAGGKNVTFTGPFGTKEVNGTGTIHVGS